MKQVGILTYHNTRNSGAALQVFALQKAILDKGYPCVIIDYQNDAITHRYRIKRFFECSTLKEKVKWWLLHRDEVIVQKKYDRFTDDYLLVTKRCYTTQTITQSNQDIDLFITGSDQVWNMGLNGEDWHYTLDFVESTNQLGSYAASFGYANLKPNDYDRWRHALVHYKKLTVREKSGLELVKMLLPGKPASVVLDPTFLLSNEQWRNFTLSENIQREIPRDYVLLYTVAKGEHIFEAARAFAKALNLKIIYVNQSWKKERGMINRRNTSPFEFIGLIEHARAIFTTSFHGVALSINLEKDFFYELDQAPVNNNSRLIDLIGSLALEEREIKSAKVNQMESIDYVQVSQLLRPLIEESHQALSDLLKSEDTE